jgi:Subtilase family
MVAAPLPALGLEGGVVGLASDPRKPHSEEWVVVKMRPGGGIPDGAISMFDRWVRAPVPADRTAIEWAHELAAMPGVEIAELEMDMKVLSAPPLTSNDPFFVSGDQWHLTRVEAPQAWLVATGTGVKLAILDGGVSLDPNASTRDGFCHTLVDEFDAVLGNTGPGSAFDVDGHGTHVAGSAAQCTGNGRRTAGMAPDASVMPVVVLEPDGQESSTALLASGISWARSHGARVINMSLGCICTSSVVTDAINQAVLADIVMVAAAGNEGGGVVTFPANDPRVIAVGATTSADTIASYSSQGTAIDLVAPGGSGSAPIWQETFDPSTGVWGVYPAQGTSMASPHVAGAAALIASEVPGATADRVRSLLRCTATDLGAGGNDNTFGTGILQARKALNEGFDPGGCRVDRVGVIGSGSGAWQLWFDEAAYSRFFFGNPGDRGFMGDWNCDGVATPGLYRSDGFVYLRNSNNQGVADIRYFFGNPGDVPLAGDFDGNGCDSVSIYRPSEGKFYIINQLGANGGSVGPAEFSYFYGVPGDTPFMGDWDGNGIDSPGLRRPSDGVVYIRNSNTQGVADLTFFYGVGGDIPYAGDWNGDGADAMGLYRPSNGFIFLRNSNSTGPADQAWFAGFGLQAFRAGP